MMMFSAATPHYSSSLKSLAQKLYQNVQPSLDTIKFAVCLTNRRRIFYNGLHFTKRPAIDHSAISQKTILQATGLSFSYPHNPQHVVFRLWSGCIAPGVSLIRGGEGRGKTTLLRLLAGELAASAGHLQIDGIGLDEAPQAYREQVCWIDPSTDLFDQLTVASYFESLPGRYARFDAQHLTRLITGLSLTAHVDKALYMLSTGTKRKVWLAAAFASGATLTLLDQPFTALDKSSIEFVMQLLEDASGNPARAVVVSHYEAIGQIALASLIDLGD
jgi:ABC-type multidrug transport system ATPase subunit